MENYTEKLEAQNKELQRELAIYMDAHKNLTIGLTKALLHLKGVVYELENDRFHEARRGESRGTVNFKEISEKTEQHFLRIKVDLFNTQKIPPTTEEIDGMITRIRNG